MKFKSTKRFVRYLFENEENNMSALDAKKFFKSAEGKNLKSYFKDFFKEDKSALAIIQSVFNKIENYIMEKTKELPEKDLPVSKEDNRKLAVGTYDFLTSEEDLHNRMQENEKNFFDYILEYLQDVSIKGIKSPKPFSGPYYSTEPRAGETLRPTDASRLATARTKFPKQGIDIALGSETLPRPFASLKTYLNSDENISARPVSFFRESNFNLDRWQKLAGIKVLKG